LLISVLRLNIRVPVVGLAVDGLMV